MNDTLEAATNKVAQTLITESTFEGSLTQTISPKQLHLSGQDPEALVANLPSMSTKNRDDDQLRIEGTIGEGGMGLVQVAQQLSLKRDVAVKSLKPKNSDVKYLRAILQEAWVTGWLEHPNIVPVYTLGRTEQNQPLIVMKRIEGQAWQEIIHEAQPSKQRSVIWHLNILLDVCNAMAYAHTRGILHRDLKPENIMVGSFGEVYVLDWGIAVSIEDDLGGRFTLAADAMRSAGTPIYMTPEAALGSSPPDVRSDIYLLGGLLHELLTHTPPHDGETLQAVLMAAARSLPHAYPPEIPTELAEICNKAMHVDSDKRFENVKAFADAISGYLEHRTSIELSDQAHLTLKNLRAQLKADAPPTDIVTSYSECRFGFQHALRTWPENKSAKQGLIECLHLKIKEEIKLGNVHAAQEIIDQLEQLGEPPSALELLRKEVRTAQKHQAKLERVFHDQDFTVSAKAKHLMTIGLILVWSGLPIVFDIMDFDRTVTYGSYINGGIRGILAVGFFAIILRKSFAANAVNKKLILSLCVLTVCMLASRIVTWATQTPIHDALLLEVPMYACFLACWAVHTRLWLVGVAALYFPAIGLMFAFPRYDDWFLSSTNACVMIITSVTWAASKEKGPKDVKKVKDV